MRAKVKCKRLKSVEGLDIPLVNGEDGKILLSVQSPYQQIEIIRWGKKGPKALLLDGEVQYIEGKPTVEYHWKHLKILRHCPYAKRVAIIGGGDGILAGMIAKKYPHIRVYVFELDPCMVHIYKHYETRVNHNAFNRENVKVIIGDAFKNLLKFPDEYFDTIFVDLPDAYPDKEDLYSEKKINTILKKVKVGGCISFYTGGIPSMVFLNLLPRCVTLIKVERAVGFFGGIGEIAHLRKVDNCK